MKPDFNTTLLHSAQNIWLRSKIHNDMLYDTMNYITLIGYTAAVFTTIAYIPQTIKVIKTKSTGDISLAMFGCISIGIFLWAIYGVLLGSHPIIVANTLSLVMSLIILGYKIKYS